MMQTFGTLNRGLGEPAWVEGRILEWRAKDRDNLSARQHLGLQRQSAPESIINRPETVTGQPDMLLKSESSFQGAVHT